jgi:hypothetical protein
MGAKPEGYTGTDAVTSAATTLETLKLNSKGVNTHTLTGSSSIVYTPQSGTSPAYNRGYYFDGTANSYIKANANLNLYHSFIVEMWIRSTQTGDHALF